jgi:hypothetical protein
MDQGEENLAVKNTALVSLTTRKTSERTSIDFAVLGIRSPDSSRFWRLNQNSRSRGHRFRRSFPGYSDHDEAMTRRRRIT